MALLDVGQKLHVFQGVQLLSVGADFLAYTPLTGETVVLSRFAYATLSCLSFEALGFQALLEKLKQETHESIDFEPTLQNTLSELMNRGFLYFQ